MDDKYFDAKDKILDALSNVCNEECREGFTKGYAKGFAQARKEAFKIDKHARDIGREEVWEYLKKICFNDQKNGGLTITEMQELFGTSLVFDVLKTHSVTEFVLKMQEFEAQKKSYKGNCAECVNQFICEKNGEAKEKIQNDKIEVGDEVILNDDFQEKTVVTKQISEDAYDIIASDGEVFEAVDKNQLIKTGRHYDKIVYMLKDHMGGYGLIHE